MCKQQPYPSHIIRTAAYDIVNRAQLTHIVKSQIIVKVDCWVINITPWVRSRIRGYVCTSSSTRGKPIPAGRSAGLLAAIASSACPAVRVAADVATLDPRKAVVTHTFNTTGGRITASTDSSNCTYNLIYGYLAFTDIFRHVVAYGGESYEI